MVGQKNVPSFFFSNFTTLYTASRVVRNVVIIVTFRPIIKLWSKHHADVVVIPSKKKDEYRRIFYRCLDTSLTRFTSLRLTHSEIYFTNRCRTGIIYACMYIYIKVCLSKSNRRPMTQNVCCWIIICLFFFSFFFFLVCYADVWRF